MLWHWGYQGDKKQGLKAGGRGQEGEWLQGNEEKKRGKVTHGHRSGREKHRSNKVYNTNISILRFQRYRDSQGNL